jgi:hypothetical protein
MSESDTTLLLVGLPQTGKSNFLAALDEVLEMQKDPNGLSGGSFAESRSYLARLRNAWSRGEDMPRTNLNEDNMVVRLRAQHSPSGTVAELVLPDMFGETYSHQCEQREWAREYRERLPNLSGLLLFIMCTENAMHEPIQSPWPPTPEGEAPAEVKQWEPKYAARQTKVVELLQFIVDVGYVRRPLRVAVMISAWDIVQKVGNALPQDPAVFLATYWPLLYQFLVSNPETFSFRPFGVSARGGGPDDTQDLLKMVRPSDRVRLVDGSHQSHDLTRPLRWLLELPV